MPAQKPGRAAQYKSEEFGLLQKRVAANARRLREARRWTQQSAAEACEMLPQHYFRIEAGVLNLTFTTLARLCRGFRVDPAELFVAAANLQPKAKRRPMKRSD